MSAALPSLPVQHAPTRLPFLGQMNAECSMELLRLSAASELLCSSTQLSWPRQVLFTAGTLVRGDRPDPQLVSDGPSPLMAAELCKSTGLEFSHHVVAACEFRRGSNCKSPSRNIRLKSKTNERRCQARAWCHRCHGMLGFKGNLEGHLVQHPAMSRVISN